MRASGTCLLLVWPALAFALSAFALSASVLPASALPADRILRLLWWTDVGFPSPFAFSTVGPGGVVRVSLIYDALTWKDEGGAIPWLARAWRVSPDGRRYAFELHPGAVWHDGRPVTARDVQFTFTYYRAHPFAWTDTHLVERVVADRQRTVSFLLREPYAPFLEEVAGIAPVVPAHVWDGIAEPRREQSLGLLVGSGPFHLAEHRPVSGDYRFVAHRPYFRGRPRFDEIRYAVMPAERQVLAVQSGQADAAMADTHDVVRAFAGHPYLRVWATEPASIARLLFNLERPPLDQKAVRHAVAHAINRTRLATLATRGPGMPGNPGVIPPGDPWYNPGVRNYPHDPARARALAAQAGALPLQLELVASPSPVVPLLQQMLREAGIDVTVRPVDAQTRAALVAEGRFQVALTFHIGASGDPDYLRRWFSGGEANLFARTPGFVHPEFQRLAVLQAATMDPEKRRAMIHRMQAILAEELPTLTLYHRRFYWVYDSRKFSPAASRGGLMNGIPLIDNKRAFLEP